MKKRPQPVRTGSVRTGSVRALSRGLGRTGVLILAWLIVTAVGTGTVIATGQSTSAASEAVSGPGVFAGLPGVSSTVHATGSTKQVGALFDGGLSGGHYCTASVVESAGKNVVVTAAHCLSGDTSNTVFVPGYHDGTAPYGVWPLESVTVAPGWTSSSDEDLDVAFAVVQPVNGQEIQDVVGAYRLGTSGTSGAASSATVRITGYPSTADAPLTCFNDATAYSADQLRIDCTDYSGGTSGSPWVTGLDEDSGTGTVIGVIGGYEEGGDTPDVSYSPAFGSAISALYQQTVAAN
ncbi:trypsin-like serine protease [Streptomyces sp. H10-C2]|uniref:trypsin-like serine peptidase n=1 Tax=unclassified Streptomyces TaxID=2593676 RepID=UPI0024BB89F8|nr:MULTISPECIES: trypsin-like serine protease [unclassified Streptomyces]MDJ0341858.1 trypsin-like serine protease [Streptomyces sp. PH10-H1]MDJ0370388.1 trypsin-like serine protease [Streptomyces sp. H10-C2]